MSGIDWFYAALITVVVLVAAYVVVARAIDAPDKGRHATPPEDRDGTPTAAWLRSLHGIPPLALARVHVAAFRATLAGATAALPPVPKPGQPRIRVDGPVPAPPYAPDSPGPVRRTTGSAGRTVRVTAAGPGDPAMTGELPAYVDWCLHAPVSEVTR